MAKAVASRKKSAKREKPKIGPPFAVINQERVAELAYKGLSNNRIAALLGVDDQTIINRYSKLLAKKRAELAEHVRDRQLAMLDGPIGPSSSSTMGVWLGKNILGQTDKQDVALSGGLDINIEVILAPEPANDEPANDGQVTVVETTCLPTSEETPTE